MARKRAAADEALEANIEKAQLNVISAKKKYDKATAELKQLLDKQEAIRSKKLIAAFGKSSRSFEEVIKFLEISPAIEEE